MPAQYQYPGDQGSISQAVEVWASGREISPYATLFVPPYPQAMIPGNTGYASGGDAGGTDMGTTSSSSQVPQSYDLEFVAGDLAEFQFFFEGVCWTDIEPVDHTGIEWSRMTWQSQVRGKGYTYSGYWWPPTWPGHWPVICTFLVTAEYQLASATTPLTNPAGTLVTLQGATTWPGDFLWDLQTTNLTALNEVLGVRTWLKGKCKIGDQVTMAAAVPPSHWPVYPYA